MLPTGWRGARAVRADPAALRGVLLALCFLAGCLAGRLYAGSWGESARSSMAAYLRDYCALYDAGGAQSSLLRCAALYFGGAALLALFGFSAAGVALIPALSALFGFLTMYAVSCFVVCFGRAGVPLAMGAMAVRLVFTLPCFFLLAGEAWPLSTELFLLSLGRGKRSSPVLYGGRYFLLLALCLAALAVGALCERLVTPALLRLALERVL